MQAIFSGSFHSSRKSSPFLLKDSSFVELSNRRPLVVWNFSGRRGDF
jgi:hypothetical protein